MEEPRWLNDTQQQAWRALIVFVNRGMPKLEHTLKAHELLLVHYTVLVELSDAPDSTLRLSDLADAANLSQSRLTHRLRTMIERGLVEITADQADGRSKNATLTEQGWKLLRAVAPLHADDVQHLIFDHLDENETAALATAMSKVASNLCGHANFADYSCS
jgi:DNA-binding MarR family transcriptional regulator